MKSAILIFLSACTTAAVKPAVKPAADIEYNMVFDLARDTCPWNADQRVEEVFAVPAKLPRVDEGMKWGEHCTYLYSGRLDGARDADSFVGSMAITYNVGCNGKTRYTCEILYVMKGVRR